MQLKKPFILLRKKNKLTCRNYTLLILNLEYGKLLLKFIKTLLKNGEKILVIDDLIATGGTAEAAAKLN